MFIPPGEVSIKSLEAPLFLMGVSTTSFLCDDFALTVSVTLIFFYLGSSFLTLFLIYFAISLIFCSTSLRSAGFKSFTTSGFVSKDTLSFYLLVALYFF